MKVASSSATMFILSWMLSPVSVFNVLGHDLGRPFAVSGELGATLLSEPHLLDQ